MVVVWSERAEENYYIDYLVDGRVLISLSEVISASDSLKQPKSRDITKLLRTRAYLQR